MCAQRVLVLFLLVNLVNINCEMKKSWKKSTAQLTAQPLRSSKFSVLHSSSYSKYLDEHYKSNRHNMGRTETFAQQDQAEHQENLNETLSALQENLEEVEEKIQADAARLDVDVEDDTTEGVVEVEGDDGEDLVELRSDNVTVEDYETYNILPGVAVDLFKDKNLVNLHFDPTVLKEVIQGRGRKYNILERIVPLLILPFLIQSAIVPFIVTKIKLLLLKSVLVGKFAIFLLMIGALKNFRSSNPTGKAVPYYNLADASTYEMGDAERKSAFEHLNPYSGHYKVDGKQAVWVQ